MLELMNKMNNCCDCKNKVDVYLFYANSYLGFCKQCLIDRLTTYNYFISEYNYPIIIPAKYIDIEQKEYWFPQIIIKFGEVETMYGKLIDDFRLWQKDAMSKIEFNIP